MGRTIGLVIFDCDGVLVDSEMLSAAVLMEMMAEVQISITPEIFRSDFLGRSFASAALKASQRFGRPLPGDFQSKYRARLLARMALELKPMAGVEDVLAALSVPFCLATGSSPERLALSLRVTGLAATFAGRAFTASEVSNGKPAPDLCLHAARRMGVDPTNCLVIEDSEMGVRAAQAAGTQVWQFAGGAHVKAGYLLPRDCVPDRSVASMAELQMAFAQIGLCRTPACR
ncbi:MAG: HAD family hydrolase [Rhizobiales bacterium]|nr:HAD family hydrolase [Hyphomicrobiales bacterium]MBI3671973.1 HAD family hydrolase [Hyphomicrobiales bacterium]